MTKKMLGGDISALNEAKAAVVWVEKERALSGGGFKHDQIDPAGPYLGDTLEMGRAFLKLYEVSGEKSFRHLTSAWSGGTNQKAIFLAAM